MGYNLVTNIESCYSNIPAILYYSHIPTAVAVLLIGIFVYWKNKKLLEANLLLMIGIFFSLWAAGDVIIWVSPDSRKVMLLWSLINLFEMCVSFLMLYFSYVFLEKRDAPLRYKLIAFFLLLPFIVLIPTSFNLLGFDVVNCEAIQGPLIKYYYFLEILASLWLLTYLTWKIYRTVKGVRKQTILFSLSVVLFLFSFSGTNIIASYTQQWWVLQYGLFSAPIFCSLLAYLIVKYKMFNVKLLAVQALMVALILLVGSQLFFPTSTTQFTILGVTVIFLLIIGRILVVSIEQEVERKEELQKISDELATANEKLRELDNAKSEFISIASHQLRTPLTAIKGFTSLLLEGAYGKISKPVQETLNKVSMSNNRLMLLVENLLNISRIEAGRIQYQFAEGHIEDLIKELTDAFALPVKEKGLVLSTDLPKKKLPAIVFDYGKIREVLSNLIDNAIKYTPEGSIAIAAKTVPDGVMISVTDTGLGIEADDLSRLFGKFERGKHSARVNVSSTGLGLYVGKNFVEAHGGTIAATSSGAGQGARFTITLPLQPKR